MAVSAKVKKNVIAFLVLIVIVQDFSVIANSSFRHLDRLHRERVSWRLLVRLGRFQSHQSSGHREVLVEGLILVHRSRLVRVSRLAKVSM